MDPMWVDLVLTPAEALLIYEALGGASAEPKELRDKLIIAINNPRPEWANKEA